MARCSDLSYATTAFSHVRWWWCLTRGTPYGHLFAFLKWASCSQGSSTNLSYSLDPSLAALKPGWKTPGNTWQAPAKPHLFRVQGLRGVLTRPPERRRAQGRHNIRWPSTGWQALENREVLFLFQLVIGDWHSSLFSRMPGKSNCGTTQLFLTFLRRRVFYRRAHENF